LEVRPNEGAAPAVAEATPQETTRPDRFQRRETAARDALRALIRDCALDRFGTRGQWTQPARFSFQVTVHPERAWDLSFDPPFDRQLERQLTDVEAVWGAYVPGRIHCFRCGSAACEHAVPPEAGMVFRGYSSTGVPEWCAFAQALIEAKDERVDQLYAQPPAVLCLVQGGHALRDRQLSAFGRASRSYAVLAQAVVGMLPLPRRVKGTHSAQTALTLQAVETRSARGQLQLRLNAVVGGVTPQEWLEMRSSEWQPAVVRALEDSERAVELMERRAQAAHEAAPGVVSLHDVLRQVPAVLRRFARDVERGGRQRVRRTRHAEDRRGERPVGKAMDDVRGAAPEALFYDEKTNTRVVCGQQGRTHVFNADGRHVTTFVLPPGGSEFRVRTQRWRRLSATEGEALRAQVIARRDGEAGG
jgi:hypothetical protein